jgi:hypothetical protein
MEEGVQIAGIADIARHRKEKTYHGGTETRRNSKEKEPMAKNQELSG